MNTKILTIAAVAGLLIGTTAVVQAQKGGGMGGSSPGASGFAPGQEMKQPGGSEERKEGPGASGFSPGHEMQESGARVPPALRRAISAPPVPATATTQACGGDGDDRLRGDHDSRMMHKDRRGVPTAP